MLYPLPISSICWTRYGCPGVRATPGPVSNKVGPNPCMPQSFSDGLPHLSDQLQELSIIREMHEFSRELLSLVAMQGRVILFEFSSLTWKAKGAAAWMRRFTPHLVNVASCARGMNPLMHWLTGAHPSMSGKRAPDGTLLARPTALYPDSLADTVAELFAKGLSQGQVTLIASGAAAICSRASWGGGWLRRLQLCKLGCGDADVRIAEIGIAPADSVSLV